MEKRLPSLWSLDRLQALIEKRNLFEKGQKVLIHAGSGGVGTFAIQLAKHVVAIVATTTSTANLDWVKTLRGRHRYRLHQDDSQQSFGLRCGFE